MTSQTKPKICHVSYSRLRHMPQKDVTVKRVIADADISVDAEWWVDEIWIQNSGIRTSLVNIRGRRRCDEGEYFDVAAPHRRAAESKPLQQARVWVGSVTTAAAKCEMRSIVISLGNSGLC